MVMGTSWSVRSRPTSRRPRWRTSPRSRLTEEPLVVAARRSRPTRRSGPRRRRRQRAGGVDHRRLGRRGTILAAQLAHRVGVPAAEIATAELHPYSGGGSRSPRSSATTSTPSPAWAVRRAGQRRAPRRYRLQRRAVPRCRRRPSPSRASTSCRRTGAASPRRHRGGAGRGLRPSPTSTTPSRGVRPSRRTTGTTPSPPNFAFLREDIETVRVTLADIGLVDRVRHPAAGRTAAARSRPVEIVRRRRHRPRRLRMVDRTINVAPPRWGRG